MAYKLFQRLSAEELHNRILYRDALILVLNKPSGIAVHAAGGSKHNLEQYFHELCFGLPKAPVLAHRLDLGTSGCLILARHAESARRLGDLFTKGIIKKSYNALVEGLVSEDHGFIDIPLAKLSLEKKHWWMKADPHGPLEARSEYRVIKRLKNSTLLELIPHTGRTHQLRVHCASLGHPIKGDYIYGPNKEEAKLMHLCLHASTLEIPLYPKKAPLYIKAPWPMHFENLIRELN
jgi:RluA family pseudouridine synthase